jgi:hypothetical protein
MKSPSKHNEALKLGQLRTGVLAAIAEMDLKGVDAKVTQAMCIAEAAFEAALKGSKVIPRQAFVLGMARAKSIT